MYSERFCTECLGSILPMRHRVRTRKLVKLEKIQFIENISKYDSIFFEVLVARRNRNHSIARAAIYKTVLIFFAI